jgi:hypothetical protein
MEARLNLLGCAHSAVRFARLMALGLLRDSHYNILSHFRRTGRLMNHFFFS